MVSNILYRIPPLFSDLAKIIAGDIDCSQATLTRYGNDGSAYFILPQAVIYPKNVTDIKHVLSFAREYTMPITPRGNGTSRSGGALGEGIILDMTRYFSHIRNINMIGNTITVDAGVTVGSLLEKLHAWNYDIPVVSMSEKNSTIGALVATKSASLSSFRHGTIREWIEGVTIVVDSGEEHHIADGITPSGRLLGIYQSIFPFLSKEGPALRAAKPTSHDDASGYNIWSTSIGPRQLIDQCIGSEGTLGILTSVTFRISPYKTHRVTSCIPITSTKLLPVYIDIANQYHGEHIFLYDQAFMQLADRYHPTLVPFFPDTPYVLLVTHTANSKEKLDQITQTFKRALPLEEYFIKTINEQHVVDRIVDTEFLYMLTSAYTNDALTPYSSGNGLIVTIPQIPVLLDQLEKYLDTLGNLYIITGNVGSGHISVIALFDHYSKKYHDDVLLYTKTIFSFIKHHKGGISAVGGEGLLRTPFLSYVYNDKTMLLFKNIKDMWDPLSILNPGKKIGTTTTYLQQHQKQPRRHTST